MRERQIYLNAIDLLQADGWVQHAFRLGERRCMGAAIVDGGQPLGGGYPPIIEEVCNGSVVSFNDNHCETVRDAIAALTIAAELAA